jgi:hypothetical protein
VLFHDVPPFDVLTSQSIPYTAFGKPEVVDLKQSNSYLRTVNIATKRLNDAFGIQCANNLATIVAIEEAIAQMWDSGWNPQEGEVNLFTTDFGCVVTEALRESLTGVLVLRSMTDLSHASVWWPEEKVEAFPFHATYKRLTSKDGESIAYFAASIRSLLATP